jgi:signal transduction histidine kinase
MRAFRYLNALAFLMAIVAAYLYLQSSDHGFYADSTIAIGISRIKEDIQNKLHPILSLNLEEFRQARASNDLVDPKTALPQTHLYPFDEISALFLFAETCDSSNLLKLRSGDLRKAALWQRFLCGKVSSLPETFFETKPFIHPSGASYVWQAIHSKKKEFLDPKWIQENGARLHLLEVLRDKALGGPGINFSGWILHNLLNGEALAINDDYVFVATKTGSALGPAAKYLIYKRSEWDRFIVLRDFVISTNIESPACLYKESNICWLQNPEKIGNRTRIITSLLFGGLVILGATLAATGIRRVKTRREEAAKRLFALQMLTHEIRTPATALRLLVEIFRNEFDLLPTNSQKAFLQMCEELQRLDRVVEASKCYLTSDGSPNHLILSRWSKISVNQLMSTSLEPYTNTVQFIPLATDREVQLERYWFDLCVKNIVDNALIHGKAPVKVFVSAENESLLITVEDQGSTPFDSLKAMAEPFCKGVDSRGLGLGLSVVQKVAKSMNGELGFKKSPTTFYLRWRTII